MQAEATSHVSVYIQYTRKHTRTNSLLVRFNFPDEQTEKILSQLRLVNYSLFVCGHLSVLRKPTLSCGRVVYRLTSNKMPQCLSSAIFIVMARNDLKKALNKFYVSCRSATQPVKTLVQCVLRLWRQSDKIGLMMSSLLN